MKPQTYLHEEKNKTKMIKLKTKSSYPPYLGLVAVLFSLTSCNSKTVFFLNWKDVIGFSILGLAIIGTACVFLLQWIGDKIKLCKQKRKRSKK